jgi:hypothetical protein
MQISTIPEKPDDYTFIAIIGSREFPSLWMVRAVVDCLKQDKHIVVSGGAQGVDSVAVDQARHRNIGRWVYKPDYVRYGKNATHVRNDDIIKQADYIIAFWDGRSPGTKSVIEKAKLRAKPYVVYGPQERQ